MKKRTISFNSSQKFIVIDKIVCVEIDPKNKKKINIYLLNQTIEIFTYKTEKDANEVYEIILESILED